MALFACVLEESVIGQCITQLKDKVQPEVHFFGIKSLDEEIELSIKVEDIVRSRPNYKGDDKWISLLYFVFSSNSNFSSYFRS